MRPVDIADYDQSDYDYISFWQERQYENAAERLALKKLLPKSGETLIDLGGGFGRLTDVYAPFFKQCTLIDYSQNNLNQAQIHFEQAGIKNVQTIQGSLYALPFTNESFDAALMVRVIHHLEKPEVTLKEVHRVLKEDGFFILEFANQIHLKARARAWLKGNFTFTKDLTPVQKSTQGGIFYNYHPSHLRDLLEKTGFKVLREISVSNLRLALLKRIIPLKILLFFENILQNISQLFLSRLNLSPSIFLFCQKKLPPGSGNAPLPISQKLRVPI